jgi:imidazolonepropionase-like amidohydrolase
MCVNPAGRRPMGRRGALKLLGASAALTSLTEALASCAGAPTSANRASTGLQNLLLTAPRVFDGHRMLTDTAVLVQDGEIVTVEPWRSVQPGDAHRIDVVGGTVLPGLIDLHVHAGARGIPFDRILAHGVTTVRELGGAGLAASAGPGQLRYLHAGAFITAPGGYPTPVFGPMGSVTVRGEVNARAAVRDLVNHGASVIKIALEPGGEAGAPWTKAPSHPSPPWPMLSVDEVRAIVEEAHALSRIVTVHLGEQRGAQIALDAGVDEWAHIPGDAIPEELLREAARRGVRVVATFDTESHCAGTMDNAKKFVAAGGTLLYGTDMGHIEIPDGFDANELQYLTEAGLSIEQALAAATSLAGQQLGLAPLGTLVPGAPADVIGIPGDPAQDLKNLEYPSLVIAGGEVVVSTPPPSPNQHIGR